MGAACCADADVGTFNKGQAVELNDEFSAKSQNASKNGDKVRSCSLRGARTWPARAARSPSIASCRGTRNRLHR